MEDKERKLRALESSNLRPIQFIFFFPQSWGTTWTFIKGPLIEMNAFALLYLENVRLGRKDAMVNTKLMRIKLSNREWPFFRLLCSAWLPTITVIVDYTISELVDVRCITLDVFYDYIHILKDCPLMSSGIK